ncbi:tumor necrosis factor receptor superfamily member 6-like [Lethenteron reissneri]|uniref:tumor necrosis factor receptor superfamily member 6-like n=1 Tax=Lethenteron reissneri TaxID=7753 RepID=UPI002AB6BCE2|nr:tumor necrosis factor receptor superfamily member 6-like [Lethenteron reissneri]XP_061434031.1 tumor necrosis factor receptor superfamily member 6-like [Lethenteron reissneri]
MVPMAVAAVVVAVAVVVSVPSAATATVSMMQTSKAGECSRGFYRAASGDICCQQCEAGEYLISDCTAEQGHSGCQVCEGGYYTEYPNSSPKCMECITCQSDEEEERQCSASTNRRCRCKPGYHKLGSEELCREDSVPPVTSSTTAPPDSGGGNTAGIVVAVVLLLLIVVAAVAAFIYKKGGRFPCERERGHSDQPGSTASHLLENNTQNHEADGDDVTPTSGRRQDASGSAGRPLDRKPSASESDTNQRESQTSTQPGGPDGDQHGAADPNGHRLNNPQDVGSDGDQCGGAESGKQLLNNPQDGDELRSTTCV